MRKVEVTLGNGTLLFEQAVEPTPETKETSGSVTVVNTARAGRPAHFEVSFPIELTCHEGDLKTTNFLRLSLPVPGLEDDTPYREVEAKAARQLAPALRAAADLIEEAVADFDARREKQVDQRT